MHYYRVPRSFKLIKELEQAEKQTTDTKNPHAPFTSLGLTEDTGMENYAMQMANWQGTIIGPQNTNIGDRFYNIRVYCGPNYPEVPPEMWFVSPQINMAEVDSKGTVNIQALQQSTGQRWDRTMSIVDVMYWIRQQMTAAARNRQPGAETSYPAQHR